MILPDDRLSEDAEVVRLYGEDLVQVFSPGVFETIEIYDGTGGCEDFFAHSDVFDLHSEIVGVNGDVINGDVSNGDVINGGDVSIGDVINGNVSIGDVINGDVINGDVSIGDVINGDVINGDVGNGDEIIGDVINGDVSTGGVSNGDASNGDVRNSDISNVCGIGNKKTMGFQRRKYAKCAKRGQSEDAQAAAGESSNLSWLLDFNVSSIFNPDKICRDENNGPGSKRKMNERGRKPRYTYTELIEQALKERGELTVSGIYNWISSKYPYYQQTDDRWKNSVRHNLSINPQFRKGKKASQGAGHFWNISKEASPPSETLSKSIETIRKDFERKSSWRPPSQQVTRKSARIKGKSTKAKESLLSAAEQEEALEREVLEATKCIQRENESFEYEDVNLNAAAERVLSGFRSDVEVQFIGCDPENVAKAAEQNFPWNYGDQSDDILFSPLLGDMNDSCRDYAVDHDDLIQDIQNSICMGDDLFSHDLNSSFFGFETML